jgi:RNA polymerase-interacting CarD/CdnL/TRCF family regulator
MCNGDLKTRQREYSNRYCNKMSAIEETNTVVRDVMKNSTFNENTAAPQNAAKSFVNLLDANITEFIDLNCINATTEIHSANEQTDNNEWNWIFDFTK